MGYRPMLEDPPVEDLLQKVKNQSTRSGLQHHDGPIVLHHGTHPKTQRLESQCFFSGRAQNPKFFFRKKKWEHHPKQSKLWRFHLGILELCGNAVNDNGILCVSIRS